MTTPTLTHYAVWDSPSYARGVVRALCGEYIKRTEHANAPTCPKCAELVAYREAQRVS